MTDQKMLQSKESQFLFYTTPDGAIKIDVFFQEDTAWLSQKRMSELFDVDVRTVSEHLQNIFNTGELTPDSVIRKIRNTASDGKTYGTQFYNLDAIISVGYRVNSQRATQFRIWATRTLREFMIKGFVLDDERLKNGKYFGKDYFDELLERIREIRASERRFYQKITDIYAQCSIDYDPKADITLTFYPSKTRPLWGRSCSDFSGLNSGACSRVFDKTVQNKLHWAITGMTAAEIVVKRADSEKPKMGLTSWKNSPKGKIQKSDVSIAKNYLNEKEITGLNRIATMYLDYAENQADRQIPMAMKDWVERLDAFLQFNDYEILKNAGSVSAEVAKNLAEAEYQKFRIEQDKHFESDFDRAVGKYLKK